MLRNKVSRERISIEINSIINKNYCFLALNYYYRNNLWPILFPIENLTEGFLFFNKYKFY